MTEQRPDPNEQPATGSAPEPAPFVDATLAFAVLAASLLAAALGLALVARVHVSPLTAAAVASAAVVIALLLTRLRKPKGGRGDAVNTDRSIRNNVIGGIGVVEALVFGYWLLEGSRDPSLLTAYLLGGLIAIPAGVIGLVLTAATPRFPPFFGGRDGGDGDGQNSRRSALHHRGPLQVRTIQRSRPRS